jgi:outer membrane protein
MKTTLQSLAVALVATLAAGAASAQNNVLKFGVTDYTTHSRTNGVTGIGVPAGADAETGDATTVIFVYERMLTPNIGAELVLGIPPRIKAKATGTVAFLGDDVLSAKNFAPTFLVNYHFGTPGDTFRPYVGAGINYTKFQNVQSKLATDVKMSDSTGWAVQAGLDYAMNKDWGLFASVAALKVKSKLVASGTTVLQTTIDFRPIVYSAGVSYKF